MGGSCLCDSGTAREDAKIQGATKITKKGCRMFGRYTNKVGTREESYERTNACPGDDKHDM